ncbi:MAG: InlB B-repeat-containing protein [Ruminococcus sp.]|nr:InlB B-repeat-containing protein [Ruminococcus sp.]
MKRIWKKSVSLLLVFLMAVSILPMNITADANSTTPKVEIVSFMRGAQEDLRSSELLEARVTGYDGNVRELTYEWTNTLGTYLYVYNSHNMYYIDGTDGEVEIYNSKIEASNNMSGRSYKDKFTGEGYCWAAVYGSNTSGTGATIHNYNAYNGTISVTVKDKNGNIIGSDSHTGKVTSSGYLWWQTYSYSGIVDYSLQTDMDDVTIGIFEGDTRNVKDLLGESAILHITCVESTVNKGRIVSGADNITLTQDGDYYITAKELKGEGSTDANGDAKVELTIEKNQCKFHEHITATATTTVYVFKKPTTSTTAYTLTLNKESLDPRCRYFINGNEGVKQPDGTILFEGLNPNTEYMVEVRAEYKDENNNTRSTYAFVYDTTLPVFKGTVEVYLNGTYASETHTATGTKVNIEDVSDYSEIYAKEINGKEFIELTKSETATGTYTSILDTGSYQLYYTTDESTKIDEQLMVMHHADRTRYLFYNSVQYKDGETDLGTDYYVTGSSVNTRPALTKDGYVFMGWQDENGNLYSADSLLTGGISVPYVLTAQWVKGIDVFVNITVDHYDKNKTGHYTDNEDRHHISLDLMSRPNDGLYKDFADVFDAPTVIDWDGESVFNHELFEVTRFVDADTYTDETVYTAKMPLLSNVAPGNDYSVEITKSGYEITGLTTTTDESGNVTVDVKLRYDPKNADLKFTVELDENSNRLVAEHPEYKPKAVDVKVLSWYTDDYDNGEHTLEANDWHHISQHHDTFVTLYLDENGTATGSYPVWMHNASGTETYYYRIKVVSYVLENGTIIYTQDSSDEDLKNIEYVTPAGRYKATINVEDGENPDSVNTALEGAYFSTDGIQRGSISGVISINTHTVTFEPDGGKFSDGTTENKAIENQIEVPDLSQYTPTRDGGYVFDGWYVVGENGDITDETVNTGDGLLDDIILRAKWKEPLTVKGIISVAGFYHLNDDVNELRVINQADRTHSVTVYLQKLLPNGYTETIQSQKLDVVYNDMSVAEVEKPMGTAMYMFTAVPDDGTQYRVLISNPNYAVTYQNEPDSIDFSLMFEYDKYGPASFMAELGEAEPLVADVNAYMEFSTRDFDLHYKVIASYIGEGFRPSLAEVLVLYDDDLSGDLPQGWPVISQMVDDDIIKGQDTALGKEGTGENSYPVWISKPDGHTLYDFAVLLKDYTINGVETEMNPATAPFFVYYNGSARYSAFENLTPQHQTQLLTIELQPKRYNVVFDMNFEQTETDHIENFEKYTVSGGNYRTGHIWSYDTDLSDATPTRQGYKFLGWFDKNDNLVTEIGAEVAEDVTLTAKWEKLFTVTFHANNEDVTEDVFRVYYEQGETPEDAFTLDSDNTITYFYDLPQLSYRDNNKYIFKGWYLDKDNNNDSRPISWSDVYTEDTHVYAHWIEVESVAQDINDSKVIPYPDAMYPGYDLAGVQIRTETINDKEHYGQAGSGLRFVTVMSEDVYTQVQNITSNNINAEYGFVIAKTETAKQYANGDKDYSLQYKDKNVNGVDTTADYQYVQNAKCSGVVDHRNFEDYRLYTVVITYDGLEGEQLAEAHNSHLTARSYMRYDDANGLLRTYYNNYTGTSSFSGCSASFAEVSEGFEISKNSL